MSEARSSRLAATIDGAPLGEDEARALWREFSEHMEANRGDMKGFAAKKGYASVAPEYREGKAVLVVWVTAPPPKPAGDPPRAKPEAARKPARPRKSPSAPKPARGGARGGESKRPGPSKRRG